MSEQPLSPSTTGSNGQRGPGGRFGPGNKLAKGNPHARRVARLRSAMLQSVTVSDMKAIVAKLVADAKAGDVASAREVLERTLGRPTPGVVVEVEVNQVQAAFQRPEEHCVPLPPALAKLAGLPAGGNEDAGR